MTQANAILNYIKTYGTITAIEALTELNCYRLAARIYDLKQTGNDIKSKFVCANNKHYSVYYL